MLAFELKELAIKRKLWTCAQISIHDLSFVLSYRVALALTIILNLSSSSFSQDPLVVQSLPKPPEVRVVSPHMTPAQAAYPTTLRPMGPELIQSVDSGPLSLPLPEQRFGGVPPSGAPLLGVNGDYPSAGGLLTAPTIYQAGSELIEGPRQVVVPHSVVQPANQGRLGLGMLAPNLQAAESRYAAEAEFGSGISFPSGGAQPTFAAWWDEQIARPSAPGRTTRGISIESLLASALENSPQIQLAAVAPHIKHTYLSEENAAFDWSRFLETTYGDTNDPIGNSLTTGNDETRFEQHDWSARAGVGRRTQTGGRFDASQRIGTLSSNSRFLDPAQQGSSRLELNYTQPLMRGRGRAVNQSLILLANIDYNTASDDFVARLQNQLLEITETYWDLYRARAEYLQRVRLLGQAEKILAFLDGRSELDALRRQILGARAAVASRRAEISRSQTAVRNAESRLRFLVGDRSLYAGPNVELAPLDIPASESLHLSMQDALTTALQNRRDISKAIRETKAASVQLGIARNEMLPQLDMFLKTYVAGLAGSDDISRSLGDQFSVGRPGFTFGLKFDLPIGNRQAKARAKRRQLQSIEAMHRFRVIVEGGLVDVETSVREVETSYQEMLARYQSMEATQTETQYLQDRWQNLPHADDSSVRLLEDLLDAQERLTGEESALAGARASYAISVIQLKRAMGTLTVIDQASRN